MPEKIAYGSRVRELAPSPGSRIVALLGPTNTGKTHLALCTMQEHKSGMIGLPLRLTVSERAFKAGGVELKRRNHAEKRIVSRDSVVATVNEEIAGMQEEIRAKIVDVPFDEG